MATTRPTDATRLQIRRKAQRVSGHGASSSTVTSEAALLSANLIRTPSQTRKYGAIGETVSASISPFSFFNPLLAVSADRQRTATTPTGPIALDV